MCRFIFGGVKRRGRKLKLLSWILACCLLIPFCGGVYFADENSGKTKISICSYASGLSICFYKEDVNNFESMKDEILALDFMKPHWSSSYNRMYTLDNNRISTENSDIIMSIIRKYMSPPAGYHYNGVKCAGGNYVISKYTAGFSGNVHKTGNFIISQSCCGNSSANEIWIDFAPNNYTVKFNGNGATNGSVTDTSCTYDMETNLNFNAFTRTGYTFTGWNTKADGTGTFYADGQAVKNLTAENNATVTLYAQWAPNTYTVTSDPANGNGAWATNVVYDQKYGNSALPALTRHGYDFLGWHNPNGTKVDANTAMQWAGNHTVTARWQVHSHNVHYDLNGGDSINGSSDIAHNYGSAINLSQTAQRAGYTFTGWSLSPGIGQVIPKAVMPDNPVTLYAQWTLEVSGLQQAMLCVWDRNNPMTLVRLDIPASSSRLDGSTFVTNGLNILASYGGANYSTSNIYVYVYDNAGNYTPWKLSYTGGTDGDGTAFNPMPSFYQQTTRHMFYHVADEMYETVYSITELAQENKTYTPKTLPVTVNDTAYSMPAGYAASHKVSNPAGEGGGYNVTRNAVTEIKYEPLSYKLTFDATGGSFEDGKNTTEKAVQYTGYYGELPVPEKEGYTFTGWYKDSTCTGDAVHSAMVYDTPADTALYAGWEANTYSLTYNYQKNRGEAFYGMDASEGIPVKYGSSVSLAPAASRTGFTFIGWNTDPSAQKGLDFFAMPAENVTLYALFKKDCVLTFMDDEGTRAVTGTVYNDADNVLVEYPSIREKDGWTPVEWVSESGPVLDAVGGTVHISETETYYASYEKAVTAGFVAPDDMPPVDEVRDTVYYTAGIGQTVYTVELPVPVERPGYSFAGWESSDGQWFNHKDKSAESDWEGIFTDSVTITGKWDKYPSLTVYDRYYTLEDAANGNITIDSLLESVTAEDEEDGILTKENGLSIPDYDETEFKNLTSNASVTVTYSAVDSFGNRVEKTAAVYVVDTRTGETELSARARFIEWDYLHATDASKDTDGDGYLDGEGDAVNLGGLHASSLWKSEARYANALNTALSGRNEKTAVPERTYTFTPSEIKDVKAYVKEHGYADFISESGRKNFITEFLHD